MESIAEGKERVGRMAAWMLVIALVLVALIYFRDFLQPIVLAIIVWYGIFELKKLIGKIQVNNKKLPNWALTFLAFCIMFGVLYSLMEIVNYNLQLVIERSPLYISAGKKMLNNVTAIDGFGFVKDRLLEGVNNMDFKPYLTSVLNALSSAAGDVFLIIIYVVFLLAEEKMFYKKINLIMMDGDRALKVTETIERIGNAVRTYLKVKTLMNLLAAGLSYVILLAFDVDFPLLWSFLIFLLHYIPYIGAFVSTLFPSLIGAFGNDSFWMFLWIFLCLQAVQVLVGNFIEPNVMGKTLNLSPLGVLLTLTLWGVLWGILGMVISVPVTSIMLIVAARFPQTRFIAIWFSENGEVGDS